MIMSLFGSLSRARIIIAALVLPLLLSSCDLIAPGSDRERAELERAWHNWELNGIEDYAYVQQRLCQCQSELTAAVRVIVRSSLVNELSYTDGSPVPEQYLTMWGTVEDLFRLIDNALNSDAASLLVSYDSKFGYPIHISIDYYADLADDNLTITSSGLTPIE
jgi:hypothetical protein